MQIGKSALDDLSFAKAVGKESLRLAMSSNFSSRCAMQILKIPTTDHIVLEKIQECTPVAKETVSLLYRYNTDKEFAAQINVKIFNTVISIAHEQIQEMSQMPCDQMVEHVCRLMGGLGYELGSTVLLTLLTAEAAGAGGIAKAAQVISKFEKTSPRIAEALKLFIKGIRESIYLSRLERTAVKEGGFVLDTNLIEALELKYAKNEQLAQLKDFDHPARRKWLEQLQRKNANYKNVWLADRTQIESSGHNFSGLRYSSIKLEVKRSDPKYQAVKKVLEVHSVGGKAGLGDREIVTDIFFATTENRSRPVFITADKGIYNKLAKIAGVDPKGKALPVAFPDGFDVTINGRTVRVLPLAGK